MRKMTMAAVAALLAVVVCMSCIPTASADGEESGYVEVKLTYSEEYISSGTDSAARISLANEAMGEKFTTLKAASDAFTKLFSNSKDGSFSSGTVYNNDNPLYYVTGDLSKDSPNCHPVKTVEFIIYGTVSSGTDGGILLAGTGSNTGGYRISEVRLTGDGETSSISGNVNITSYVAGHSTYMDTPSGTLTVSGITFLKTDGTTGISALGHYNQQDKYEPDRVSLVINDCVFNNQTYTYGADYRSKNISIDISRCTFNCGLPYTDDDAGYFAYGAQGFVTEINFTENTVTGYETGILFEEQHVDSPENPSTIPYELNVNISGNTFSGNTDHTGDYISLKAGASFTIEDNVFEDIVGNAIAVDSGNDEPLVGSVTVSNNNISAEYVLYNALGAEIVSYGNTIDTPNKGLCIMDGVEVGSELLEGDYIMDPPDYPWLDDDDDYVPVPPIVMADDDDNTVTIVACAAAAVVAALMAVYLIIDRKR